MAGPEGLDAMKVDNIRPQKIDSPHTTRSTWLAQKALRGMNVATPSLNWIPLSSTFGHGVSVSVSGRLQFLGYATGNLPSWASRGGDEWPLLRDDTDFAQYRLLLFHGKVISTPTKCIRFPTLSGFNLSFSERRCQGQEQNAAWCVACGALFL